MKSKNPVRNEIESRWGTYESRRSYRDSTLMSPADFEARGAERRANRQTERTGLVARSQRTLAKYSASELSDPSNMLNRVAAPALVGAFALKYGPDLAGGLVDSAIESLDIQDDQANQAFEGTSINPK